MKRNKLIVVSADAMVDADLELMETLPNYQAIFGGRASMVKRVRTVEEIVFEQSDPPVTLAKGSVYGVETVLDNGIILFTEAGDRFMIDLATFEAGFEAVA